MLVFIVAPSVMGNNSHLQHTINIFACFDECNCFVLNATMEKIIIIFSDVYHHSFFYRGLHHPYIDIIWDLKTRTKIRIHEFVRKRPTCSNILKKNTQLLGNRNKNVIIEWRGIVNRDIGFFSVLTLWRNTLAPISSQQALNVIA